MNSNEDLNPMSNMDGQMMPKWTQMKTGIPWAIWMAKWCQNELNLMNKWCQNELKWRLESHEQYGWTNDAKMNSNEDLNPMSTIDGQMMPKWTQMNSNEDLNLMSNMDGQMMPKWTQMKTWIPWAIWMDKWCQNKLKWRLESHEQCGWINDAKWTQMKTWIPWAIWMDKWCQNELKWRLESHEQYGWTNDAKMNSNELKWRLESHEQYMDGQMMPKWTELKWRLEYHEQYGWTNDAKMNSNEDLNPMSNMDGQMMPKWISNEQMKTWISWAIWMDKWCQNELKWRLESHEQYGWTNDAKMNSNEDLNPMSNWWTNDAKMNSNELKWRLESHEQYGWTNDAKMNSNEDLNPMSNIDGQMMPMKTIPWCQNDAKWTQMKTWIPWAIWMDKWCQNELKWRLESHEQYGWTNDAKMNSNEDLNLMSNMDGQMMPKWTEMKTWIPWAIWMDKWCQNELKWRLESHEQYGWTNDAKMNSNELKWLESHEQYGWTNDAKMNSNEDLNTMSNMDGQMMPKWTQMKNLMKHLNPMSNMDGQMMPKWTQMKTWIPWAIWMDKWCQNELKWRLESHEHYWWTNDAKMNSNELKWRLESHENMDGQMMPKWTQMKTWIPWAIWMDKWCQNELKWRLESHEQYGWTNDAKWTQMNTWIPWAIWMDKWCQNELKWRLEYHEQYGWTNDAKMNSNEDLNPMSNIDGQMMPKWTQMNSNEDLNPWAIWMDKWCQNELKWRLESHEQYEWTNDAKMNSNEDLNPMSNIDGQMPKWSQMNTRMSNMDGQMMPKWTQMKTWIPWAIWMDKWCQNKLMKTRMMDTNDAKMNSNEDLNPMSNMDGQMMPKWTQMKTQSHEQYGWTNDAKMNSNEDLNPNEAWAMMDGQMMPKWTQMKTWIQYGWTNDAKITQMKTGANGWTNDAKMNSNEDLNPMSNMDGQMMPKWTQMKTWIPWAIWMDKWCQNELKWRLEYPWANDGLESNDNQMMPKWTQMKTWWAIWMDKWCQNELKWRLESHEQYGWTNDAKMNSNEDLNPMSNMDGQMMPKWTQMKTWIHEQYEDAKIEDSHEQYGWTNDAKMNSNEDLNPMSTIDGQMMPKWTQMNSNEDLNLMSNMDGQMMPKWTQMKTWIPWAIWMDKWCQNKLKWRLESHEQCGWINDAKWTQMKTWIPWAIWMDKWCQNELKWRLESNEQYGWPNDAKMNSNELKWRLESHEQYGWTNDAKMKWRLEYHEQYGWTNDAKMNSNEDLNPMSTIDGQMMPKWTQMNSNEDLNLMSNMDGQMMPKWTQMKTWIPWAIWMDKWCQNELKWRLESHEQCGWINDGTQMMPKYGTNDAKMNSNEDLNPNMDGKWCQNDEDLKWWAIWMDWCQNKQMMNSNEDLNPMSNMDGQMMPKWTQMKTGIQWAIWMAKWCQNELKWTQMKTWIHEQYGWTNDAKMNWNEDLNTMSNMDGQMMPKWTQMKTWIPWAILMDKWCQNELKWTQMTWISWAIWMDKWCQNELKWRLESHEQYGWTNDAKMNSNEDLNPMSNMDKWCQMNSNDAKMNSKLKWRLESNEQYGWPNDAKMNSNELKWRLESHEQYGWTNDAKMNSNEDLNTMSNMDGQMMPKWTQMKTWIPWAILMDKWCQNELKWTQWNLMSNMDGQMMPKWTQMKTWIPWAIWMDKWCQNELKWRLESHEQLMDGRLESHDMDGQMMQNELKWRLESHEQYGWTNDAKMNSNEDLNPMSNMDGQMMPKWTQMKTWISWAQMKTWISMSNMDGQMMPKWTQMKTWIPWAIWMDKWCQNELKWRLESHEQYGWTNDAKMNSNEDLNTMSNMDGQMMPKWTQMKTWIPWAIWMDKWCQNELKWRLESYEQYGWTNDAKINSNDDLNPMSNMNGQMMPKWIQMKTWIPWAILMDKWCQNELKWTQMKTWIPWAIWMDKWCQNNSNEDWIRWAIWRCQIELNHEQYGWTNDAKMNSNEDSNPMSNMDGEMMPKWTQMKTWISWAIWMDKWCQNELKWRLESHDQNELKWSQMKTWISWAIWCQMMPKWTQMKTWIPWAIWMDKWCQNELKWRLESHEQYGWTNDAKMNSNEDLNPMSNMDGQMMPKWTQMNSNEDLNLMSNMDGQMMPKWTQMKTWIPWAIWMDKWCQNELKWRLMSMMDKWCQNELKWRLESMSNMDGQMMPKWTQMKTEQWINDAMNSNEDLNPMSILMDKWCQNELKWTQMKTWISWAIWMDKWCQNELKWRLEYHEQYGWTNDAKINSNEDSNPMSNVDG